MTACRLRSFKSARRPTPRPTRTAVFARSSASCGPTRHVSRSTTTQREFVGNFNLSHSIRKAMEMPAKRNAAIQPLYKASPRYHELNVKRRELTERATTLRAEGVRLAQQIQHRSIHVADPL